ncbi:MAG: DUF748 domain-containing protein [Desulfobulbaceae bacterium]|nr:DUF748 domain-containing protein [Desulfobulbaceae bacterium]
MNSSRKKQTKNTGGSGDLEDRFGRIAPAAHAENRARDRKPKARGRSPLRTRIPAGRKGRRSRPQMVVFFFIGLLLIYITAMYLVVPVVVRGSLAEKIGRSLDCRLSIDTFTLSPFTLRFRGERILLKSPNAVGDEKPLLQVAALSGRIQPLPLLQGRVRIGELRIDQPEVFLSRDGSGRYNLPSALAELKQGVHNSRLQLDPDIFSFQIVEGIFIFDDQLTGNTHRVEHLLYNPDAKGGVSLQATVNGSPVTISRGSKDLLQLQLNNIELGRYLAYLPVEKELPVSLSGRVDGTLEFSLPAGKDNRRFTVQGVLALQNVHIAGREDLLQADIPAARFSFELTLPEGQLLVRELVLRQPSFILTAGSVPAFLDKPAWLDQILQVTATTKDENSPGSTSLRGRFSDILEPRLAQIIVGRLLVDQGRLALQAGSQTFQFEDVQVSIIKTPGSGTANGSHPATFQLSARQAGDMSGELTVKGTFARGSLNGHLRVSGINLAQLPKTVEDGLALSGLQGNGELDADILVKRAGQKNKQRLYLRNSRLQLHDFEFLTRGGGELSAKSLLCQASELSFDTTSGRPLCDRLDLEQAEIRFPMAGIVQLAQDTVKSGSPLFADLELLDSTIHLVDDDKQDLVSLQRVLLRLHGLPGRVDTPGKIGLQAGIGEKGLVRLSGDISPGKTQLEYAFKDVALVDVPILRSWSSLQVEEGQVRARGRLVLPEAQVTGKFVVDDFLAVDASKGSLQWRQLTARGVNLQLHPPACSIDEVDLDSPVIRFQQGSEGFFPPFARDLSLDPWWRDTVVVKKVGLARGRFQSGREGVLPGLYPTLTDLAGTVEGWPADSYSFTLNGKLEGGGVRISGRAEGTTVDYRLQVNDFPLAPLAEDFLQTYGLTAGDARLSWQPSDSQDRGDGPQVRCVLTDLRPLPGSPLEQTLALLTDTSEEIVLTVEPVDDGRPLLLLQRVIDRLQAIRLRELNKPGTTLQNQFPFLELSDMLEFQTGLDSSDGLFFLDDYAELLQSRPHLRLLVAGGMDPDADGAVLQEVLQEEADARLEVENLRRQQERAQLSYLRKLETAGKPAPGSSVESAVNEQVPEELRPLPWQPVEVPAELLENLADKRAQQVRQYLVTRQGIAPERIVVRPSTRVGSAAVSLSLEPFFYLLPPVREGDVDDN